MCLMWSYGYYNVAYMLLAHHIPNARIGDKLISRLLAADTKEDIVEVLAMMRLNNISVKDADRFYGHDFNKLLMSKIYNLLHEQITPVMYDAPPALGCTNDGRLIMPSYQPVESGYYMSTDPVINELLTQFQGF